MPPLAVALAVLALTASVSMLLGCVLFTGGTDGYRLADAAGEPSPNILPCIQATDCTDAGEDASGFACCLVTGASLPTTVCTTAICSGRSPIQLCKEPGECGDAGLCVKQACAFANYSVNVFACGLNDGCSPLP